MMQVAQDYLPRAAELRPGRRRDTGGGRPYIGPKVQVNVPDEQYDFVVDLMRSRGWGVERFPDALREVFAAGVASLRGEA